MKKKPKKNIQKKRVSQKKLVATNDLEIGKKKRFLFSILMFLLPILFLFILESVLSLIHYGGNLKLVVPNETDSRFYRLNHEIGREFFPKFNITPAISYDVFLRKKPKNGYRIFVFGGSSAAGYPYMNNGAFSRMLRTRLQAQFPDRTIEVVNTAMPAVNTFTVLDFVKELVHYKPDAFLFYTGHNEFYGALGVASTETLGKSRKLIKFYLALQHYRTVRLTRNIIWQAKNLIISVSHPSYLGNSTLMERMVRQNKIAYRSELYEKALDFFKENVTEIIQISQKHSISVLFGELVSNIRDQKPFISIFNNERRKQSWKRIIEKGVNDQKNDNYELALKQYKEAIKTDFEPAITYYLEAQCYENLNQIDSARDNYYLAKDFDALRFRAPEDFNEALRKICHKYNVPIVPLVAEFQMASPKGLIGDKLMTDHLHPNINGNFLMARSFFNSMKNSRMISSYWDPDKSFSDSVFKENLGITDLDMALAQLKIDILKNGWPFKPKGTVNEFMNFTPKTFIESVVWKWERHHINWEQAHVLMAEYYQKKGDLEKVAKEYSALIVGTPFNDSPYYQLAHILILQKKYNRALPILKKYLKLKDTAFANKWIGTIQLKNGNVKEALYYLRKAALEDPSDQQTLYNLAGAYFLAGRIDKAIRVCEKLEMANPNYPGLQKFMHSLKKLNKNYSKY